MSHVENLADDDLAGQGDDALDEEREAYYQDLFLALSGKMLSDQFKVDMATRQEKLSELLDGIDTGDLKPADLTDQQLESVRAVQAAEFFTEEDEAPEQTGRRAKLKRGFSKLRGKDLRSDQQKLKDAITAEIRKYTADIVSRIDKADGEVATYGDTLKAYMELSVKMLDADRPQAAFELFENARAIEGVLKVVDAGQRQGDQDAELSRDARARDEDERELETKDLATQYKEIRIRLKNVKMRRDGVVKFGASLIKDMEATGNQIPKSKKKAAALEKIAKRKHKFVALIDDPGKAVIEVRTDLPGKDDSPAANSDNLADVKKRHTRLDQAEEGLDAADAMLAKMLAKRADAAADKFGKLAEISGGSAERSGADLTGHGDIKTKSNAKNVPQAVLQPIAAKLDAIRMMGQAGSLQPAQFDLMKQFEADIVGDSKDAEDSIKTYDKIAELFADIEKQLKKEEYLYWTEQVGKFNDSLEALKAEVGTVDPAGTLAKVGDLKEDVLAKYDACKARKKTYDDIEDAHDKVRKNALKAYSNKLAKVMSGYLDAFDVESDAVIDAKFRPSKNLLQKIKEVKRGKEYEGKYATEWVSIWNKIDRGDVASCMRVSTASVDLDQRIKKAESGLDEIIATIDAIKKGNPISAADAGKIDLDNPQSPLGVAVNDLKNSGREIVERSEAKKEFKKKLKKLKNFIDWQTSRETAKFDKGTKDAFKNYKVLVKSLESRTGDAETSSDWHSLQKELDDHDRQARTYVELNKTANDAEAKTDDEKVAAILSNCQYSLDGFCRDLRSFFDDSVEPEIEVVDKIIENSDSQNVTAEAVKQLLTTGQNSVVNMAEALASALEGADLNSFAAPFAAAQTWDEKVKVREDALSAIRRRRLFLEEINLGLLYRANPFDLGTPATVAIKGLMDGENGLLTEIKR